MHARIVLIACLLFGARAPAGERWQTVTADGQKVGHSRISRAATASGIVEVQKVEIELGASSRRVDYHTVLETESAPDGQLRRISREVKSPEGHSIVAARAVGDDLEVSVGNRIRMIDGGARGLKTDEAARSWLALVARGAKPDPLVLRTWDPVTASVVDVYYVVTAGAPMNIERRARSARDETTSSIEAGPDGDVVRELMRVASYDLEFADAAEAEARRRNEVFDHVARLLQKAPYRIPDRDRQQKIRYRFDNHDKIPALPVGAGQRTWTEGGETWIQVCASCPLDDVPLADTDRARALAPSPWLESADPMLARRAVNLTARIDAPARKMQRLTFFVRHHMGNRVDMLGYGTALEALRTRRGDCTEYAVLLAALGRAAGIPTRIAIGRVYSREFERHRYVFVPHAWVQAWTGRGWESFDAAIGTFDSTHLAFAVSYDGNPVSHFEGIELSREMTMTGAARVVQRARAAN